MFSYMLDQFKNSFDYNSPAGKFSKQFGWRGVIAKGGHFNGTTYSVWKKVASKDVTDGTSKTVAIMEKAVWVGRYRPDNWTDGWSDMPGWSHNAHQSTMRSVPGDGGMAFGGTYSPGQPGRGGAPPVLPDNADAIGSTPRSDTANGVDQGFGSAHSSGFFGVFADGSVRAINYDVDTTPGGTLFRLACRDDGLQLDESSY